MQGFLNRKGDVFKKVALQSTHTLPAARMRLNAFKSNAKTLRISTILCKHMDQAQFRLSSETQLMRCPATKGDLG